MQSIWGGFEANNIQLRDEGVEEQTMSLLIKVVDSAHMDSFRYLT